MTKTVLKSFAFAGLMALSMGACNNAEKDGRTIEAIKEETIAVHDEIMPQIGSFDRQSLKIDSILTNLDSLKQLRPELDTAEVRADLTGLKNRLEGATDSMMQWMNEFEVEPEDKSEAETKAYFESELKKITDMKKTFSDVTKESTEKLAKF